MKVLATIISIASIIIFFLDRKHTQNLKSNKPFLVRCSGSACGNDSSPTQFFEDGTSFNFLSNVGESSSNSSGASPSPINTDGVHNQHIIHQFI